MPIYDYQCKKCKSEYDVHYPTFTEVATREPKEKCPKCRSKSKQKLVSKGGSFILKGPGWAKDNYGK